MILILKILPAVGNVFVWTSINSDTQSGYRFYPVVHVSRLKAVNEFPSRPRARLTQDVTEESRLDFDEELLLKTAGNQIASPFKVKWVGYDEPTREPASNLSCGGLLYDYLRAKKSDRRLQMVQVADED
ncbi:Chromo domain-like [Phytophthora cactorum]|nr:Chromo domain-like [Phytophthora cactorum]